LIEDVMSEEAIAMTGRRFYAEWEWTDECIRRRYRSYGQISPTMVKQYIEEFLGRQPFHFESHGRSGHIFSFGIRCTSGLLNGNLGCGGILSSTVENIVRKAWEGDWSCAQSNCISVLSVGRWRSAD
jgi:hypothetical protein